MLPRLFIFSTLPYRRDFSIPIATASLPFACGSTSFVCQWTLTPWNHHLRPSSILLIRQVVRFAHAVSCKLVTASSSLLLPIFFLRVTATRCHHRLLFLQAETRSIVIGPPSCGGQTYYLILLRWQAGTALLAHVVPPRRPRLVASRILVDQGFLLDLASKRQAFLSFLLAL